MNDYDDTRWQNALSASPAGTATAGGSRNSRTGDGPDRGQPPLWCGTNVDSLLAQGASRRRRHGTQRSQAWPQMPISPGRPSSGHGCASDQRTLSRPIETAVCTVDPRCRSTVDRKTLWRLCFRLDGRTLSATMGVYAPETASPCLRTESREGETLVGQRLPSYPASGSTGTCPDTLGRRNGNAIRSPGWTQLWPQRENTGDSGDWPAFWLQHDFGHYEQRSIGVHGIHRAIHGTGDDPFSPSADQAEYAEGVLDCRWPSGASFEASQTLGPCPQEGHPVVLPARVQPTVESGRVPQPGRQDQCGGPTAAERSAANDAASQVVFAKRSTSSSTGQKLLPAGRCALCGNMKVFNKHCSA